MKADKQVGKYLNRQASRQEVQASKQASSQESRQTGKVGRQAGRQAGRADTCLHQLVQQLRPEFPEVVSSSETAITTNTHEVCDGAIHQVLSGNQFSFTFAEIFATSTANDGATLR